MTEYRFYIELIQPVSGDKRFHSVKQGVLHYCILFLIESQKTAFHDKEVVLISR
jgi:hypothetical protein